MSTYQQSLTGESAEMAHLTRVRPKGIPSDLEANADRNEWWCKECQNRVTVSYEDCTSAEADIDAEYGHERSCDHSCWEASQ